MISKRSFFKKLGAVIAAVAIAPEIAFRTKLDLPQVPQEQWVWGTYANMNGYAAVMEECSLSLERDYLCELIMDGFERTNA